MGLVRGLAKFAMDFMLVGVGQELIEQLVGRGEFDDVVGSQKGDESLYCQRAPQSRACQRLTGWGVVL